MPNLPVVSSRRRIATPMLEVATVIGIVSEDLRGSFEAFRQEQHERR